MLKNQVCLKPGCCGLCIPAGSFYLAKQGLFLASKIKIRSRSRNWLCLEFSGPIQKEAPRKVIYSALNIVVKRIRESRVIAFSVRKPYFSTLLAGVGNPAFSFISTENQGVSPRASRRGFLCPQKHAPGFFPEPKLRFWIRYMVLW